ncbi:MAG: glycosyltransferase [Lentisphaeraceae bacterium]|nr:glycosyltransferase [Lentisphaeraceae bacterium]
MFSLIIPVYNEAENLPLLLEEICSLELQSLQEIVIVDDSEDELTKNSIKSFLDKISIQYIHRQKRLGLATAVIEGFKSAKGDWLVCMDGDGSHPVSMLSSFEKSIDESPLDVLVGSRYVEGGALASDWPWYRRLVSKLFCLSVKPLTAVSDSMSGCFAVKKDPFLENCSNFTPIGYKILLEILVKIPDVKFKEIPLCFSQRRKGDSKITQKIMLESVSHIYKLYKFKYL